MVVSGSKVVCRLCLKMSRVIDKSKVDMDRRVWVKVVFLYR